MKKKKKTKEEEEDGEEGEEQQEEEEEEAGGDAGLDLLTLLKVPTVENFKNKHKVSSCK